MTTDPDRVEKLISVQLESEAAALVAALADRGIEARATGGLTAAFRAEAPGEVNILVHAHDLPVARQALADIDNDRGTTDWSKVDVGTPEV